VRKTFWVLLLVFLAIRLFHFFSTRPKYTEGVRVRIKDKVFSEPIRFDNSQYFKLSGFKVYLPSYPQIYYGDEVVVEGIVSGRSLKKAKLIDIVRNDNVFSSFRKRLIEFYQASLPQPHSFLISGVTLGSKSSISEDFWEALKKSGTAHVVVASGMNVTLISSFLISFLALFLPRRQAIPFALLGVWVYAVLTGFDAPIIRASIMGSLVFTAQELGRLVYSIRVLFLSAFLMLFAKPDWLLDTGFQLSFAATLSLILLEKRLDIYFKRVFGKVPSFIRKDFSTSLAAQVGVIPILYSSFGQISIFSPITNALVLWTIVPITIIGLIGGLIGLIYEPIGTLILWLTYPLTSFFILIVKLSSNFISI